MLKWLFLVFDEMSMSVRHIFGPDLIIMKWQRLESAAVTLNDISIPSQLPWKIMIPSCPRDLH